MWPQCFLANKLIKMDEESVGLPLGDCSQNYPFEHSCSPRPSYTTTLPHSHCVDVPHIHQLYNWDCGLACVLMVLKTLGIDHCDLQSLANLCSTTSIWTVDLAYLLQKFSVSFSFLTVTLGANPNFSAETYYKEQLQSDVGRVDKLFGKARESGIDIECRCISGEEISMLILSGQFIAVALVDKYKLSCQSWLEDIYFSEYIGGSPGYTGHFVVICGYDADRKEFEIRDPASPRKYERVSMLCLEKARKSFGTDEDILLVSLERKAGVNKFSA
ncbi:guanylyl cyclase 1-like isoform X1 [Aristolochia californica]|uniref:guanylyl cyclase 1-like isoform X1 n=1 Tax=Aristolochia californica TaxID=171875 RepID=UPI0035D85A32